LKNIFWEFKNASKDKGELMIYGDISDSTWWGDEVTPKQFKEDLDALGDVKEIDVYINSGGGDVFAGQAIYTMLKRHEATITVHIDGLAASIASVIAMAGDKILIPKGSMMMVHNGLIGLCGYFQETKLRKYADEIKKITDSVVVPAYERTGQTVEKIHELMDAETWMSAEDAVRDGFADEIEAGKQVAASLTADMALRFRNAPQSLIEKPKDEKPPVEPPKNPDTTDKEKLLLEIDLI
jgi:ATP-dependent Clp protease protease subunit